MKNKILAWINIIIPLILFIILNITEYSDNIITIITLTLFVGWLIPYLNTFLTGIALLTNTRHKMCAISNILSTILSTIITIMIISIYDNNFLSMLLEYIVLIIINLINSIYYIIYLIKHHKPKINPEYAEIKKIKKENNGIIK